MDELLRKLAVEGWWAWVILLAVVTIVYLGRHRAGLASLLQAWEPWSGAEAVRPYLAEGEDVRLLEGPLAVTDRRVLVRKRGGGPAFAAGALDQVSNVEYGESHSLLPVLFGIFYIALGVVAMVLAGNAPSMMLVGALIVLVGLAVALVPLRFRGRAALIIAFSSGRPIILSGRIDEERLQAVSREIMVPALERRKS
jgi:hypothetical protein